MKNTRNVESCGIQNGKGTADTGRSAERNAAQRSRINNGKNIQRANGGAKDGLRTTHGTTVEAPARGPAHSEQDRSGRQRSAVCTIHRDLAPH